MSGIICACSVMFDDSNEKHVYVEDPYFGFKSSTFNWRHRKTLTSCCLYWQSLSKPLHFPYWLFASSHILSDFTIVFTLKCDVADIGPMLDLNYCFKKSDP